MTSTNNNDDPLNFLNLSGRQNGEQKDLVQSLLYEIIRVKELIKYYDSIPNGAGQLGSSILNELVSEAYASLVNYDTVLMQKYYDLLLNCDWLGTRLTHLKSLAGSHKPRFVFFRYLELTTNSQFVVNTTLVLS